MTISGPLGAEHIDNWKVHLEVLTTLYVLCKGFVKEVIKG